MFTTPEAVIASQIPLIAIGALLCYEVRRIRIALEALASRRRGGGS